MALAWLATASTPPPPTPSVPDRLRVTYPSRRRISDTQTWSGVRGAVEGGGDARRVTGRLGIVGVLVRGQKKPRRPSPLGRGTTCTWRWATLWLTMLLIATNVPSAPSASGTAAASAGTRGEEAVDRGGRQVGQRHDVLAGHQQDVALEHRADVEETDDVVTSRTTSAATAPETIPQNAHPLATRASIASRVTWRERGEIVPGLCSAPFSRPSSVGVQPWCSANSVPACSPAPSLQPGRLWRRRRRDHRHLGRARRDRRRDHRGIGGRRVHSRGGGKLIVATSLPAPGFWGKQGDDDPDNIDSGLEWAMAQEFASRLGLDYQLMNVDFTALQAGQVSGYDIALVRSRSPTRVRRPTNTRTPTTRRGKA